MKRRSVLAAAIAAICGSSAHAASDLGDIFRLNAYGTLGVVHSNQTQADYVSTPAEQARGAGYTRSWSPDVDSKLAVQLTARLTEKLTGVVQLISENDQNMSWTGKPNPRYRPSLEWANLNYDLSDHWSVRAGRMVLPALLLSEYRNIGYSLLFIRPPVEIYNIPFTNLDGAEISYQSHIGNATNTITGVVGATTVRTTSIGALQSHAYLLVEKLEAGALTVFGDFLHNPCKSPTGFGSLFQDFVQGAAAVPGGEAAAETANALDRRYNLNHWDSIDEWDVGMTYEPTNWIVMAEFTQWWSDGVVGGGNGGFITAGYHTHGLTPYAMYSRVGTFYSPAQVIPLQGLPPDLAAYGDTLNGIAQSIAASNTSQRTLAAGLRWDFMRNFDLKLQYDYVKAQSGSIGQFAKIQPGFQPGSSASVFSAAIDFVF